MYKYNAIDMVMVILIILYNHLCNASNSYTNTNYEYECVVRLGYAYTVVKKNLDIYFIREAPN